VSFRQRYILEGKTPRELALSVVKDELSKFPEKVDASKIKVKKAFQSYVVIEMSSKDELRPAADILSKRKEILATEFLQKKRIFGVFADIEEMAKFRSKVTKVEPPKEE
jgi:hypothetical protein